MAEVRGREISIIYQDAKASLIPYMTIEDHAIETWKKLNRETPYNRDKIETLLEELHFDDPLRVLKSYPNQLSGGECQRAYIMLALLGSPELIIADEPTSSLDPYTASKFTDLLIEISGKFNVSLILISHSLAEVMKVTEHIYVMYKGFVIEELEVSALRNGEPPKHPYAKYLFSMATGDAFEKLRDGDNDIVGKPAKSRSGLKNTEHKGCIYWKGCALKNQLNGELQTKCNTVNPEIGSIKSKVACWAYEK